MARRRKLKRHSAYYGGGRGTTVAFSPDSVSGLIGWYKADAITAADNDPVTTWEDSHTSNNDLVAATNGPTYKTNIQNSLPVVRFDGTDDNLQLADTAKFRGTGGFTVFVVGKYVYASGDPIVANSALTNTVGYRFVMHTTDGIRRLRGGNAGSSSAVLIDSSDYGTENQAFEVGVCNFDAGTGGSIRRNGVEIGTAVEADIHDAGTFKWTLMANSTATVPAVFTAGDVGEVLYFEPDISGTDITAIETYLTTKWGIV